MFLLKGRPVFHTFLHAYTVVNICTTINMYGNVGIHLAKTIQLNVM